MRGLAVKSLDPSTTSNINRFLIPMEMFIDWMDIDEDWCTKKISEGPIRDLVVSMSTWQAKVDRIRKLKYVDHIYRDFSPAGDSFASR